MKTSTLLAVGLATTAWVSVAQADFTDYFWIDKDPGGSTVSGTTQILPGGASKYLGNPNFPMSTFGLGWTFYNASAAGGSTVQISRAPTEPTDGAATGFQISVLKSVLGGTAQFGIIPPPFPSGGSGGGPFPPEQNDTYVNLYRFTWAIDLTQAGAGLVEARYYDENGMHILANTPGLHVGIANFAVAQGSALPYGFELVNFATSTVNTLQIQGWEPVPEPSTVAMGLVTVLSAGAYGYRRYRANKA